MKRVTGIGGVFFKSEQPENLKKWYWQHLGVRDYVGVDLSADTIRRLNGEYPKYEFRQADITWLWRSSKG